MPLYFFASDLHGSPHRYDALFQRIAAERPDAVLLGGDLFCSLSALAGDESSSQSIASGDHLCEVFREHRKRLGANYPPILLILGNDDPRSQEAAICAGETEGLWTYANECLVPLGSYLVFGYAYVPPTPFMLKDWERYDVSRSIDPGCVTPEEGFRSVAVDPRQTRFATITEDLDRVPAEIDPAKLICLFHTPPYQTKLDRAALDGKMIEHVPLDVHVGSIAVRRFIEDRQPLITLHGHVHESARLTGSWRDQILQTHLYSAAHDGPELALVRFDPDHPEAATRELI
jgi:Icc-related predicted phosphoesterase